MPLSSIIHKQLLNIRPERAHYLAMDGLRMLSKLPGSKSSWNSKNAQAYSGSPVTKMGIEFPNPVGLAAGFDKDGKWMDLLPYLGFGFIEVGTVTPKGQSGNPKPRLFRLKPDKALINRMGFNNDGVEALVERFDKLQHRPNPIGGNIGKNKVTPNKDAIRDYEICFDALWDYVDYYVVNVSSPNTPGLRELQNKDSLNALLGSLQERNHKKETAKPILLKIAPDLNPEQRKDVVDIIHSTGLEGLISHNTTIDRSQLQTPVNELDSIGNGGLSGKPLTDMSLVLMKEWRSGLGQDKTIIGVGGIMSPEDAKNMLEAGADLIQVYTGFVYGGQEFIREILRGL